MRQASAAAIAVHLAGLGLDKGQTRIHLASTDRRAEEIGRALATLAPDLEVLVMPPWDCLPYDRASPGREIMGRRMTVFRRLAAKSAAQILLVSPESLLQRAPPATAVSATFAIASGQPLNRDELISFAGATGYISHDRVDEPGEIALLGEVVDVYPSDAALPVRIVVDADGRVANLRTYDPLTQRTNGTVEALTLGPASELVLASSDDPSWEPGVEHRMSAYYPSMPSLFELVSKAKVTCDVLFTDRLTEGLAQIVDAFEAHKMLRATGDAAAVHPAGLYLSADEAKAGLDVWRPEPLELMGVSAVPSVAGARNPGRAFCEFVESERATGRRVVLVGLLQERRALARALRRGLALTPNEMDGWSAVLESAPGSVIGFELDIDTGFVDIDKGLTVIAASDVMGGRLASPGAPGDRSSLVAEPDLRLGDVVLHEDHGIGVLRELQTVQIDGVTHDTLRLEYYGSASVLAPVAEIGRIWRYGAEEAAVTLDRVKGEAWPRRRAEVSRHLDEAAARLVELAKVRSAAACKPVKPPLASYARFAARFGYPETKDQAAAIAAVLADLASWSANGPVDLRRCRFWQN